MIYDVMHFEALGEEAKHLEDKTLRAQKENKLPNKLKFSITPENIQDFLSKNQSIELPNMITTKTHSKIPPEYLSSGRKSIITRSAGYDHIEHPCDMANITSLREYCVNSVAQTAMKFMYAAAGLLNHYTTNTLTFERNKVKSFMEFDKNRVVTIFGVGKIGKRVYELVEGNGLTAQAVDVRQTELETIYSGSVNFVSKEEAFQNSDIIINAMNLTKKQGSRFYNINYFTRENLMKTKPGLIFINLTRGDIAPESVLCELYNSGHISVLWLDVFTDESGFSNALNGLSTYSKKDHIAAKSLLDMAIDRTGNIYVQPHQAFNSDVGASKKAKDTIEHMFCLQGFRESLRIALSDGVHGL